MWLEAAAANAKHLANPLARLLAQSAIKPAKITKLLLIAANSLELAVFLYATKPPCAIILAKWVLSVAKSKNIPLFCLTSFQNNDKLIIAESAWRDVRVVEGARLESVYRGNSIKGSNPFLSVRKKQGCEKRKDRFSQPCFCVYTVLP